MVGLIALLTFILAPWSPILALEEGFNRAHIAKCEIDTLRLGSDISDVYNGPIDGQDWSERVNQNFIIKHLGFAPWTRDGVAGSGGKTLTKDKAGKIMAKGGWTGRNISDSPYAVLDHQWIYMYGDSTTRQIWASYAAPFQANNFERNAKEWTRQYCNGQDHRKHHVKNGNFPEEGWHGPCGVNEVTCYVSGYGDEGLLTYDWKHFVYEDYDEWLFSDHEKAPWTTKKKERRPDVLTIQTGMHTCWHADPAGLYSEQLKEQNKTMIKQNLDNFEVLMKNVRAAVNRRFEWDKEHGRGEPATRVIVVTSGATYAEKGAHIENCILRMNRAAARAAHKYGFAVLERGEIERRFMYKSLETENPLLGPDMHLAQPVQNIVSTCLLNLLTCLSTNRTSLGVKDYLDHNANGNVGAIGPLHTPPNP
jgi:hypothetical protein